MAIILGDIGFRLVPNEDRGSAETRTRQTSEVCPIFNNHLAVGSPRRKKAPLAPI